MKFPLPVRPFPTPLSLSERDRAALTSLSEGLVSDTVLEFDQLLRNHSGSPDRKQWKAVKQRQNVTVYAERASSSGSGSTGSLGRTMVGGRLRRARSHTDVSEASESRHTRSRFFGGSGGMASSRGGDLDAAAEPKKLQQWLWHGFLDAQLDDVLYGIVNQSEPMALLKASYVDDSVVDSAILAVVQSADEEDPFRGLHLRWAVRGKAGRVLRHRDFVFLEATGTTSMNPTGAVGAGEKVGFHIVHSLDVRGVPALDDLKIVRGKLALYQLFRQRANGTVEVFAKVQVDLAGDATQSAAAAVAVDKVSMLFQVVECAQQRKLNWMLYRAHADVITAASIRAATATVTGGDDDGNDGDRCSVCSKSLKKPALFQHLQHGTKKLMKSRKKPKPSQGCCICSAAMCSRCSVPYKLSFFVEQPRQTLSAPPQAPSISEKELRTTQVALECCTRCVHAASQLSARRVAVAELEMADPLAVYRRLELFDKLASSSSIAPPEILDIEFDAGLCLSVRDTDTSTVMHLYDREFGSTSSLASLQSSTSSTCSQSSAVNAHATIGGRFA